MSFWNEAQFFEGAFWGNCINTFSEELKQRTYARLMGLELIRTSPLGFGYDLKGASVVDIGGGPVSMLLKCVGFKMAMVADPCPFPKWVHDRYATGKIGFVPMQGEDLIQGAAPKFQEAWIYNVLQHTEDPGKIIANAKKLAPRLRIFEWVNLPAYEGHPQEITAAKLEEWIGQKGQVVEFHGENECYGQAFYGCFDHKTE